MDDTEESLAHTLGFSRNQNSVLNSASNSVVKDCFDTVQRLCTDCILSKIINTDLEKI